MERMMEFMRRLLLALVALIGGLGTYLNFKDGEYAKEFAISTIFSLIVINWIFSPKVADKNRD